MTLEDRCDHVIALIDEVLGATSSWETVAEDAGKCEHIGDTRGEPVSV
jgi:hypothetical protein